jgi:hypothetical protein
MTAQSGSLRVSPANHFTFSMSGNGQFFSKSFGDIGPKQISTGLT